MSELIILNWLLLTILYVSDVCVVSLMTFSIPYNTIGGGFLAFISGSFSVRLTVRTSNDLLFVQRLGREIATVFVF